MSFRTILWRLLANFALLPSPKGRGFFLRRSLPFLEDSNVVDVVILRKDGLVDPFLAAPGAADGRIQDQVVRLVEGPDVIARPFVLEGEVLFVIKEKVDPTLIPFIR